MEIKDFYTYLNTRFKFEGQPRKDYLAYLMNLNKEALLNVEDVILRQTQDLVSYLERQEAQRKAAEAEEAQRKAAEAEVEEEEEEKAEKAADPQAANAEKLQELLQTKQQQEEVDRENKARLLLLQNRNLEREAERVLEAEIEQQFVNEKYKYADDLNKAIDGGKETTVNVALTAIYTPVAAKTGPDKKTIAKWKTYLDDLLKFDDEERGQVYSFDSIRNQSDELQRNVIKMFVYRYILNAIKKLRVLRITGIEAENIKTASDAFNNLFDQTMKPVFERIGKIIEATKSYQSLLTKIDESNKIVLEKAKEKVPA